MTTVLVTGAAGNLGRRVTASLAARDSVEWVLAVDRVPTPASAPKVEPHTIDLSLPHGGRRAGRGGQTGDGRPAPGLGARGDGTTSKPLRHVLDAVEAVEPTQLVHLSSATVYGAWPDNPVPLTEEMTRQAQPRVCVRHREKGGRSGGRALGGRAPRGGRGPAAAGLHRRLSTEQPLYQALAASKKPPLGSEGRIVQYLHIDDLAEAVVHSYEQCLAGTYNVAPDSGVQEEIAGALAGGSAMLPLPRRWRAALSDWRWRLWAAAPPRGLGPTPSTPGLSPATSSG